MSARTANDEKLKQIGRDFGTPVYVYDLDTVVRQLTRLRDAFPMASIHYAVKANANRAILELLAREGIGAEVLTLGELERATRAGFPADRILLGGPGQALPLIERAKRVGVGLVSLDSASQHELWASTGFDDGHRFLVRVNPALEPGTHEHLSTGSGSSKFGMPRATAFEVAEVLSAADRFAGFHIHVGSQIRDIEVYAAVLDTLRDLHRAFPNATLANMGGGFAVPGFPVEALRPLADAFLRDVGVRLVMEPGRFLVAEAGFLLASVLHVKDGGHVIADAGMADFMRPAMYGARHPIRSLEASRGAEVATFDLEGPLCENADRLGREVELETPVPGDVMVIEQAGAYGFAMASNYVSSLRPAEVVLEGGHPRLVRRRETVDDLLAVELALAESSR